MKIRFSPKFWYIKRWDVMVTSGGFWMNWGGPAIDRYAIAWEIGFVRPIVQLHASKTLGTRQGWQLFGRYLSQMDPRCGECWCVLDPRTPKLQLAGGHHRWEPFPGSKPGRWVRLRWRLVRPFVRWRKVVR